MSSNVPELPIPATLDEWKKQRKEIRETLVSVMGDLPARPKVTQVKTLSRENKGAYTLEKFEFDNGAGATVPGYLLIPTTVSLSTRPSTTHIGMVETMIWESRRSLQLIIRRRYPLMCSQAGLCRDRDRCLCFGERSGKGPGWAQEMAEDRRDFLHRSMSYGWGVTMGNDGP
jgi:hypothetical protein